MRVLIVDHERPAQVALANVLKARSEVERFDFATDTREALQALDKDMYDVVLLDVGVPGMSGIEFVDRLHQGERQAPSIVIVAAHDKHAIAAFERQVVDYVLKPFSTDRINQALDSAFRRAEADRAANLIPMSLQLRASPRSRSPRIAIKAKGRILLIDPHEVVAVQSEGNYVLLHRQSTSDLLRASISVLEEQLRPYGFVRIHRSVLVNSSHVEEIEPCSTGEYVIRTTGGKHYMASRTYKNNLRPLADLWIGSGHLLAA